MSVDKNFHGLHLKVVSSLLNKFNENEPRVFIEIEWRGAVQRTKTVTSHRPVWEEDFQLEFSPDDSLSVKLKYGFVNQRQNVRPSLSGLRRRRGRHSAAL